MGAVFTLTKEGPLEFCKPFLPLFYSFFSSTLGNLPFLPPQQRGAVEACWAHNPEVDGSKPSAATLFPLFFFLTPHIFKESCAHSFLRRYVPLIAQLVERRTVVGFAEILRSLVRIRLEGQLFFFQGLFSPHSLSCQKIVPRVRLELTTFRSLLPLIHYEDPIEHI